jgi:hypothetical protein
MRLTHRGDTIAAWVHMTRACPSISKRATARPPRLVTQLSLGIGTRGWSCIATTPVRRLGTGMNLAGGVEDNYAVMQKDSVACK